MLARYALTTLLPLSVFLLVRRDPLAAHVALRVPPPRAIVVRAPAAPPTPGRWGRTETNTAPSR
jgi:hypothetical protein